MAFLATQNKIHLQGELLKQSFLECLEKETQLFTQFSAGFMAEEHPSDQSCAQFCQTVILTVDRILAQNKWDDSLFLHNALKPLKNLREQAAGLLEKINGNSTFKMYQLPTIPDDCIKLYISIFQNDGHNLRKWELQLKSINSHLMGRAIYQREEDAQSAIRVRTAQNSEAYIVVAVKKTDIQNDSHIPRKDRNGNLLLTLKSNAVSPENILEFIHSNKRYYFLKGKLVEAIQIAPTTSGEQ